MATVQLDAFFLQKVSALSTVYVLDVSVFAESDGARGEVRAYANGRRRSISTTALSRTWKLSCDIYSDRTLVANLQALKGQLLLARDPYGRKMYCVTYDLDITEVVPVDKVVVSFTLTEVTYSEAVT